MALQGRNRHRRGPRREPTGRRRGLAHGIPSADGGCALQVSMTHVYVPESGQVGHRAHDGCLRSASMCRRFRDGGWWRWRQRSQMYVRRPRTGWCASWPGGTRVACTLSTSAEGLGRHRRELAIHCAKDPRGCGRYWSTAGADGCCAADRFRTRRLA